MWYGVSIDIVNTMLIKYYKEREKIFVSFIQGRNGKFFFTFWDN